MKTLELEVKFEHDINEGWACVSYYLNDDLIASDDGSHTEFFGNQEESKKLVGEYWEQNGQVDPNWDAYNAAIEDASFERIQTDYADEFVLIRNSYEQATSNGFANTYYIVSADEGDESPYGHRKAQKVSTISDAFKTELVDWAKETKGFYWFN